MRSQQDILELILDTAKSDERVRSVIMNGSRANPNARPDIFQDFDIVFLVTDVRSFRHNCEWIKRFGELMILQMPEDLREIPASDDQSFMYLMQFTDGNRIDLRIYPLAKFDEFKRDSLSLLLLDKDGIFEQFPAPSELDYLPKPPSAKAFADCCNEFWWVCPYVAKGLWREEIIYAKQMLDGVLREQLMRMLTWHLGVQTEFSRNPGKLGKYFKQYLDPTLWQLLQKTYTDASYDHTWEALFAMCQLFRTVALPIAEHFGFEYPSDDDSRVSAHLEHLRSLPKNAEVMY